MSSYENWTKPKDPAETNTENAKEHISMLRDELKRSLQPTQ